MGGTGSATISLDGGTAADLSDAGSATAVAVPDGTTAGRPEGVLDAFVTATCCWQILVSNISGMPRACRSVSMLKV